MCNLVIFPMVLGDSVLLDNGYNERFYRATIERSRIRELALVRFMKETSRGYIGDAHLRADRHRFRAGRRILPV